MRTGFIVSKDPIIVRAGLRLDSEKVCLLQPGRLIYLLDVKEDTDDDQAPPAAPIMCNGRADETRPPRVCIDTV